VFENWNLKGESGWRRFTRSAISKAPIAESRILSRSPLSRTGHEKRGCVFLMRNACGNASSIISQFSFIQRVALNREFGGNRSYDRAVHQRDSCPDQTRLFIEPGERKTYTWPGQ
jgi:hypothetical protein